MFIGYKCVKSGLKLQRSDVSILNLVLLIKVDAFFTANRFHLLSQFYRFGN